MSTLSARVRVAIIDGDLIVQNRFSEFLRSSNFCELVGVAHTGTAGIALANKKIADVYLIDLGLPDINGLEVIRHINSHHAQAKIMVVTMFGDAALLLQSLEAGATGYLLKNEAPDQFIASIVALQNGGTPISPNLVRSILDRFIPKHHTASEVTSTVYLASSELTSHHTPESSLTPREKQILFDLSLGMTVIRIADKRTISPHSVSQHLRNIYRKLRVRSRAEAVYIARCQGLLQQ